MELVSRSYLKTDGLDQLEYQCCLTDDGLLKNY